MSKITLEPNDLGAGIFRLRSPNSNSNRSFTLPDSDGILLTLNPDGRLGIGTSNPDSELEVVGTIKGTNGIFDNLAVEDLNVPGDFTAGTITETSSEVLKTDIEPLTDIMEKISALEGVSYVRKASGKKEIGFIAEDVEKVLPELVHSSGEYKSISYSRLTAYLIEAVKSLKTELDEIQK